MTYNNKTNKFDFIRIFCHTVENNNSATLTAKKLGKTRQTICNKIDSLEKELEYKLFKRKQGTKWILTKKGKEFYENEAKKIVIEADKIFKYKTLEKIEPKCDQDIEHENTNKSLSNILQKLDKISSARIKTRSKKIYLFSIITLIFTTFVTSFYMHNKLKIDSYKKITESIANNILDNEKQIEERLLIASLLLEQYLQKNKNYNRENLTNFTKIANVDRVTLHSIDGKNVLGSTNIILTDQKIIKQMQAYNLLDRVTDPVKFLSQDHNVVIFPMGRDTVTSITSKPILRFSKTLNIIISCALEVQMQSIIKQHIALYPNLIYISISTPSGTVFADSKQSDNIKVSSVENYQNNIKIIENNNDTITLRMCFGGLQQENAIRIIDKTINSQNQYFYVLTAIFTK